MAMNDSFAGGLADGLRNGMAIGQAYDAAKDRKLARDAEEKRKALEKEIATKLLGDAGQQNVPVGLDALQVPQSVPNSSAVGDIWGLQPVEVGVPAARNAAPGPDASSVGLADSASGPFGGTALRQAVTPTMGTSAEKKSPQAADYLGGGEFGQIADGLTRAYRRALELGEPGRAMQLLADREKFVGQHREQAFNAAQSRYQLTGDPNSYVPFVNRFMPGGIEVTSINKRSEQAGGAPVYDFVGVDTATGKAIQQPISEFMLQDFVRSVSDPKAQQAMVAQQAKSLWEAEQKRRNLLLESQLRSDEERRKPRVLNKDQTLYVPDGKGGMQVGAQGSEAGKPKTVTSDKDFASYIMRLNGVESMEGLGEDQRQRVGEIIAIGENINRLNAGSAAGKVLSQANLAALSQQVRAGLGTFEPIQLSNGTTGFTVRHEGTRIRVPLSLVPNKVQQMVAARLEGRENTPGSPSASGLASAIAGAPKPDPASTTTTNAGRATPITQPATESAEGAQLDAARMQLNQAQNKVRELRTKPPGLKAGELARARHAELLRQAERDVEVAKAAEAAAADRWAQATQGSELTRAAMGRPNVEDTNEQL